MIHEQGLVMTELNGGKGIYCEMCSHATKDNEHKITISTRKAGCDFYQHICVCLVQWILLHVYNYHSWTLYLPKKEEQHD